MQRSFIEKGVVLTYKLPSHTLWARNSFHDHAYLIEVKFSLENEVEDLYGLLKSGNFNLT